MLLAPTHTLQRQTTKLFNALDISVSEQDFSSFKDIFTKLSSNRVLSSTKPSVQSEQYQISLLEEWLQEEKEKSPVAGWQEKAKYVVLMLAGTLYFGCEGFDGATAMLGIFSLPASLLLAGGLIFSLISVLVFYSFDLVEIASNLGVQTREAPALIDLCIKEAKLLKKARDKITFNYYDATIEELQEYQALLPVITQRYEALMTVQKKLLAALDNDMLKIVSSAVSITAGILFFAGGFFSGQTVALAMVTAILGAAAAVPTFWPVLVFSLIVGIAAFGVYWYVERPGVELFVSKKFGLDKEQIETFCEKNFAEKIQRSEILNKAIKDKIEKKEEKDVKQKLSTKEVRQHGIFKNSVSANQPVKQNLDNKISNTYSTALGA